MTESIEKARTTKDPVCFYPAAHRPPHAPRWAGRKNDMFYSMWKLNAVCQVIRGKSLLDAKKALNTVDKKGAGYVSELLQ